MTETDPKKLAETLRELRLANMKSQATVAHELGVSRSTVTQMELGNRTVKAADIARLASVYGCSTTSVLAAPRKGSGPDSDDLIADFTQTVPELARDETALKDLRDAIAIAQELTSLETSLCLETYSSAPPEHGFGPATTLWEGVHQGYAAAHEERLRISLGDAPIRDLQSTLALMRVRATKTFLPEGISSLVLQAPETGFLVVINRRLSADERRFQYVHAYAHTLFDRAHQWLVCRTDRRGSLTEVRASAFATRFLLPESGVQRYLHSLGKDTMGRSNRSVVKLISGRNASTDTQDWVHVDGRGRRGATPITACDLSQIARYFGVSRSLVAQDLRNLRHLTERELVALERLDAEGVVERVQEALDLRAVEVESGRDAFRSRLLGLAVEALSQKAIDPARFTELAVRVGLTDLQRQSLLDSIAMLDSGKESSKRGGSKKSLK